MSGPHNGRGAVNLGQMGLYLECEDRCCWWSSSLEAGGGQKRQQFQKTGEKNVPSCSCRVREEK